jgi:acetate---CoA ligase (ADP-forming)
MEAQIPVQVSTASAASPSARKWSPAPDASDIVKNIHAMLHPRNIVLVGATDKPRTSPITCWCWCRRASRFR